MITIFERFEEKKIVPIANVGDYILLDIYEMDNHNIQQKFNLDDQNYPNDMAQITKLNTEEKGEYFYHVKFSNDFEVNIRKEEILRLLTDDEIEKYEIEKNANKYNL